MLATLRKYAKTAAVVTLFGLLIIAFATFNGMDNSFKAAVDSSVLTAAGRKTSSGDFKRIVENQLPELGQRAQGEVTLQDVAKADYDQQILQQVAAQESFSALISKAGLKPGAQLTANMLRENPRFFDPVTGKFDRKAFIRELNGRDPKLALRGIADEIASRHFEVGMTAGLTAPRAYGAIQAALAKDNRSISYFTLEEDKVPASAKPTDAQLTALMNEFADRLRDPELRELTIVRFSAADMTAGVTLDQAQVQKLYDFRKDEESVPETRTLVQIPVKDAATGQTAAARLSKGEDAAAVAKSLGAQLISYDAKPKTAIPDRKVADAAFALAAGQVSAPIKGDLGYAVVRVLSITPGKTPDLALMRAGLEKEVRRNGAEQKATEAANEFQKLHDAGATLAEAAAKSGAKLFVTPPIAPNGAARGGAIPPGLSQKLVQTAFRLGGGSESEIETDTRGEYYVVKVEKVIPPALPPFATLRPMLEKGWTQRDVANRMKAKADELAARVRKGESLEAAAASIGASVKKAGPIDRTNVQSFQTLGEILGQAFQGKTGEVYVGVAGSDPKGPPQKPALLVARVDTAGVAPAAELAEITAQARAQAKRQLSGDVQEQVMKAASTVIKPKTYPERARDALGVDVPLKAADGKKTAAKDKAEEKKG